MRLRRGKDLMARSTSGYRIAGVRPSVHGSSLATFGYGGSDCRLVPTSVPTFPAD